MTPYTKLAIAFALAGLLSHNLIFIRGEHHLWAPKYVQFGCLLIVISLALRSRYGQEHALKETSIAASSFLSALFTSMIVYRLAFHPLRSFPGPFMWKISKLWHVFKVAPSQKNYLLLDELYHEYGPFVRTGPGELTVFHPEVFDVIGGTGTTCIKAPWYDMLYPMVAINSVREKAGYAPRRRVWNTALSTRAVHDEKSVVLRALNKMGEAFQERHGQPLNVTEWMSYFTSDTMGELAFNKSFGMLDKHEWSGSVQLLRNGLAILGTVTPAPWLAHVAFTFLPKSQLLWASLVKFAKSMMEDRLEKDSAKKDVSYWMIEAGRTSDGTISINNLYGDAFAMIIAGSHTVATTLIFTLKELANDKKMQDRVRKEVDTLSEWDDVQGLEELTGMNAILNETMRLYPVVPTGGIRMTTNEPVTIGGTVIPPYTTIVAPRYTISRLENAFERATEFIPERWTSKPEMIKDKRAYNPFNNGRHSCPGKNLGLMEVRLCLSMLLSRFDISYAAGEDGSHVWSDMTDSFTANPGALRLTFTARENAAA
ncbi:Tryprostatin B 6-hydroxylase [Cytospora mali]|uniref:Tryprostatin B 6-hydroxylase n=1 Tax=Cytospora mali TaxID=578113 RepID=A0A194V1B9_CYTMA|nr:Tryprostatin B 6-hydroxylase [Valsa mali var. pyri (nom. inval.)]